MRRLTLTLALLMMPAGPCFGQLPKIIQTSSSGNLTCTFTSNVTSGDVLIMISQSQGSGTVATATDSLGTPTIFTTAQSSTGSTYKDYLFIGTATASGADTITTTWVSSSFTSSVCEEWNFGGISTTVDATVGTTFPSNSTVTSGNLTTTANGDLLISGCSANSPNGAYSTTDQWLAYAAGSVAIGAGWRISGTNGNYSTTYNFSTGGITGIVFMVAFKPTSTVIVSPATLPDGIQNDAYTYRLVAQGGAGAYTWSITSGNLPTGLSLNSSTGVISGTPTNSNGNTIVFHVTDGTHTANLSATLHVGSGAATVTHVQDSNTSGVFGSNVTSGNIIIVPLFFGTVGGGGVPICTDTLGTALQPLFTGVNGQGGNAVVGLVFYSGIAPSTGADTVTCASKTRDKVSEFSGVQNFSDSNIVSNGNSAGIKTFTTASLTPLASNALLFGGVGWSLAATPAATVPCTIAAAPSSGAGCWQISTTQTGYTLTMTSNNNQTDWALGAESFRPASTGTAPPLSSGFPVIY